MPHCVEPAQFINQSRRMLVYCNSGNGFECYFASALVTVVQPVVCFIFHLVELPGNPAFSVAVATDKNMELPAATRPASLFNTMKGQHLHDSSPSA